MNLAIFLLLLPLLASLFLLLYGAKITRKAVAILGIIGIGASALGSMALFYQSFFLHQERQVFWTILSDDFLFLPKLDFALYVDPLAIVMSMMVSFVSFWIALYSTVYMKNEQGYVRFFVVINLFVAFMLLLVFADNLFLLFMAWEGVGICSYLLIGFYYQENDALQAAMKAFLTTRVGDLFLLLAMILSLYHLGTTDIKAIISSGIALDNQVPFWLALCFIAAAAGKSAQFPLQIWLPDAMWGPTPVSALIHASTMVTAGVYLLTRMSPLIFTFELAQYMVLAIGCITLIIGAAAALLQNDLKKVLAYSTMSQIGYMFLALGVKAPTAAIFHVITHAFFKSLLFLCAGLIGHALHSYHMDKMGGLYKKMPWVGNFFVIGCLSLVGLPLISSGFFSKEAILNQAYIYPHIGHLVFFIGLVGVFLTSLYAGRMVFLVLFNEPKSTIHFQLNKLVGLSLSVLALFSLFIGWLETPKEIFSLTYFTSFLLPVMSNYSSHNEANFWTMFLPIFLSIMGIVISYFIWSNCKYISKAKDSWFICLLKDGGGFNIFYTKLLIRPYLYLCDLLKPDPLLKILARPKSWIRYVVNLLYDCHLISLHNHVSFLIFCAVVLASWMVWQ